MTWAGIDVGGVSKGFHVAVVGDEGIVVGGPQQIGGVEDTVAWLQDFEPKVVAVDSPCACAPDGERSREGERGLARAVCGIRWTPEFAKLAGNPYYEWIENGLALYRTLGTAEAQEGWEVIEVFPTASWTRWAGPRGKRTRAAWTRKAFEALRLDGLPSRRLNQDDRDAVAAALTAKAYGSGDSDSFGEIIVPK